MRKRRAIKKHGVAWAWSNRRRAFLAGALALSLIIGGVILAQRSTPRRVSEKQNKAGESGITTASLDTPSKEYVYAGGRLIATEEPTSATTSDRCTIGLFRPSTNYFYLRNTNSLGPPDLTVGAFGAPSHSP